MRPEREALTEREALGFFLYIYCKATCEIFHFFRDFLETFRFFSSLRGRGVLSSSHFTYPCGGYREVFLRRDIFRWRYVGVKSSQKKLDFGGSMGVFCWCFAVLFFWVRKK